MDHAVPPDSPAPKRLLGEGFRRGATKSTCPSPLPLCRGRNFVAGTWTRFTLLSLEKPLRHAPWRRCAWPNWLNALDWRILDERARPPVPESSRRRLFQPPTQVYRTPIQNLAAAARIAESIQPSQSEAGRGLLQIRALLRAAGDQNSVVSQSRNRIHNRSVVADTVQSAHSPRSPPRREGRGDRRDQHRRNEQYDHRFDHDDQRR